MDKKNNYIKGDLDNFFSKIQRKNPNLMDTMRIQQAWYKSVDESIAQHTCAVFVVPNTNCSEVIIYADNAIWTAELNMRKEILRMNLNIKLKEIEQNERNFFDENAMLQVEDIEVVKKLSIKTSKENYKKQPKEKYKENDFLNTKKKERIQTIPLTEEEENNIKKQLENIDNEELKNAMFNAMRAQIELEKAKSLNENK